MQLNFELDSTSTRRLKDSLELATHDAALSSLRTDQLAEGKIVFDQVEARRILEESLQENLLLDSSLHPQENSFFQNTIEIKLVDFIDDSLGIPSYPTNYIDDDYQIIESVEGPAIVVVLETTGPRYFIGDTKVIRQAVVYEYQF